MIDLMYSLQCVFAHCESSFGDDMAFIVGKTVSFSGSLQYECLSATPLVTPPGCAWRL
jgi:hypothetical protein